MERHALESPGVLPDILTVQEVAEYLKVSPKTVYALLKQGDLPSFRVGRAVRCRRSDLEHFVQASTHDSHKAEKAQRGAR